MPAFIGLPGAREKTEIGRGLFERSEFRSPVGERSERQEYPITSGRPFLVTSLRRERSYRTMSFWRLQGGRISCQVLRPRSAMSFWKALPWRISRQASVIVWDPQLRSRWHYCHSEQNGVKWRISNNRKFQFRMTQKHKKHQHKKLFADLKTE